MVEEDAGRVREIGETSPAPAGERAYGDVKARILSGELGGGELISEGDVAERLGVSRTPVREAFLRLQAEGWMRLYPKRGALILSIAPGESREVLEARALLEGNAVVAAVSEPQRLARLVSELDRAIEVQRRHAESGDTAAHAAADADFHRAIVEAGGNGLLAAFYGTLRDRQVRMVAHSVPADTALAADVVAQHVELRDAIAAGDAAGFASALQRHFSEVHAGLLS